MVTQTVPVTTQGFAKTLDRAGQAAKDMKEFHQNVWVRFRNAPDYILKKLRGTPGTWNTLEARDGNPSWCGMRRATGESLVQYIYDRRIAENRFAAIIAAYPRCNCAEVRKACWNFNLAVRNGDGPTVQNWTYSDTHPGVYSDEAWTSSKEVAPGVHLEMSHACLGRTRAWVIIAPIPEKSGIEAPKEG